MKNIKILHSDEVCKIFVVVELWEQNSLLDYKDKNWMSMPAMEKGAIFTEPAFSPIPSPFDINQNIPFTV